MPIEFFTSLTLDLVYARWEGRVDFAQFEANFRAFLSDAHYRPGRAELIDLSAVTELDLNLNLLRAMLRQVNEQVPIEAVQTHTVLYSPNETVFGVGRMYQTLAELAGGIEVEVHRTEADVFKALGLKETGIEKMLTNNPFLPASLRGVGDGA